MYTFQPFDDITSHTEASASFLQQTQQIATDLNAEMKAAVDAKKSKDELIAIAEKYADFTAVLTKAYSRWTIMNTVTA